MTTVKPVQSAAVQAVEAARKIAAERVSPVQKALQARQTEVTQRSGNNFFESEDFLRMKAFEIRARIVLYQNLGLSQEYAQAQAEGAEVVKKYQALLAKGLAGKNADTTA